MPIPSSFPGSITGPNGKKQTQTAERTHSLETYVFLFHCSRDNPADAGACLFKQSVRGSDTNDARITDILSFVGFGKDPTVLQTMNTQQYPYCYRCKEFRF